MTLEGYDISHHQTTTPDLSGVEFVIVRATYGTRPDEMYPVHVAKARAAGKIVGAYHFARPTQFGSAAAQAEAFLAAAPDADLWCIDRELDRWTNPDGTKASGTITVTATKALVAAIHATGRRVGLYTSQSNWKEVGQDFAWVARWSTLEPSIPWDIWQWEGGGDDKLDNDTFRGTRGALLALGAPRREWAEAQVARADAAQAEADGLRGLLATADRLLTEANADLAAAHATIDERDAVINNVATGLRLVREFEEAHP